jgi:hypothetical protein
VCVDLLLWSLLLAISLCLGAGNHLLLAAILEDGELEIFQIRRCSVQRSLSQLYVNGIRAFNLEAFNGWFGIQESLKANDALEVFPLTRYLPDSENFRHGGAGRRHTQHFLHRWVVGSDRSHCPPILFWGVVSANLESVVQRPLGIQHTADRAKEGEPKPSGSS